MATSGVVLSTALHASDADYAIFVIGERSAALDSTLHTCLLEKVFPGRATVISSAEFVDALE